MRCLYQKVIFVLVSTGGWEQCELSPCTIHGCQMVKAIFIIVCVWQFQLEGLCFHYATLQNFILSFLWIASG